MAGSSFDPAKNEANREKHGIGLDEFAGFDEGTSLMLPDTRADYGEPRYRTIGLIGDVLHMIVFTHRDGMIRLISFRRAHEKERRQYEQRQAR
jgi:hypothetical protein